MATLSAGLYLLLTSLRVLLHGQERDLSCEIDTDDHWHGAIEECQARDCTGDFRLLWRATGGWWRRRCLENQGSTRCIPNMDISLSITRHKIVVMAIDRRDRTVVCGDVVQSVLSQIPSRHLTIVESSDQSVAREHTEGMDWASKIL